MTDQSEAQQFLSRLESLDSNTVHAAVNVAAEDGVVTEGNDWENGRSIWTFADGSSIVMEGPDVSATDALFWIEGLVAGSWDSDACGHDNQPRTYAECQSDIDGLCEQLGWSRDEMRIVSVQTRGDKR